MSWPIMPAVCPMAARRSVSLRFWMFLYMCHLYRWSCRLLRAAIRFAKMRLKIAVKSAGTSARDWKVAVIMRISPMENVSEAVAW